MGPLDRLCLAGRTQDSPDFDVYQARKIVLDMRSATPVEFDGEDEGTVQRLVVDVVPRAVQVLLPEGAPAAQGAKADPVEVARRSFLPVVLTLGVVSAVGTLLWRRRR